jgi:hypothetical protein
VPQRRPSQAAQHRHCQPAALHVRLRAHLLLAASILLLPAGLRRRLLALPLGTWQQARPLGLLRAQRL